MSTSPDGSSELFAAKGRAMPACSERLEKRSVPAPARDGDPGPIRAPVKGQDALQEPQDDGPASVLSIDLRRVLVPAPQETISAPEGPSPAQTQMPPPRPQGHAMAGPVVAAMVAIAVAGGVFFLLNTDRLSVTRVAEEPAAADAASAPAEETGLPAAAAREPDDTSATPQEAQRPTAQDAENVGTDDGLKAAACRASTWCASSRTARR